MTVFRLAECLGVFVVVLLVVSPRARSNPLPFQEAMKIMVSKSSDVASKRAAVASAEALKLAAWGKWLPSLSLDLAQKDAGDPYSSTRTGALTAKMNLYRFGVDSAGLDLAQAEIERARVDLEKSELAAEAMSATLLIDYLEACLRDQISEASLGLLEKHRDLARQRYEKGYLPKEELEKISIDFSNSEAKRSDTLSLKQSREAGLIPWLGASRPVLEWPWKDLGQTAKTKQLRDEKWDPSKLPGTRVLQLANEKSQVQARRAFWSMFPSLDLVYSTGQTETSATSYRSWSGVVSLTIPLFSRFEDYSDYRSLQETAAADEISYRQSLLELQSRYEDSAKQFELALSSALSREKSTEVARRLLEANSRKLKEGRSSANDVMVDQNRLLDSQIYSVLGWSIFHKRLLDLYQSRGVSLLK